MRIPTYSSPVDVHLAESGRKVAVRNDGASAPAAGPAAEGMVKVRVSEEAKRLAAGSPGFDEAKVNRLRDALANGELTIDPQAIAAKILEE
jgi:flagellar biosynthesis anti-sigma factor FlgM